MTTLNQSSENFYPEKEENKSINLLSGGIRRG